MVRNFGLPPRNVPEEQTPYLCNLIACWSTIHFMRT